jgi:hypothetical protein
VQRTDSRMVGRLGNTSVRVHGLTVLQNEPSFNVMDTSLESSARLVNPGWTNLTVMTVGPNIHTVAYSGSKKPHRSYKYICRS